MFYILDYLRQNPVYEVVLTSYNYTLLAWNVYGGQIDGKRAGFDASGTGRD